VIAALFLFVTTPSSLFSNKWAFPNLAGVRRVPEYYSGTSYIYHDDSMLKCTSG